MENDSSAESEIENNLLRLQSPSRNLRRALSTNTAINKKRKSDDLDASLTDLEILHCSICRNSLTIPVFQCENGHLACSSCCLNVRNRCPFCLSSIGHRSRAIEKVMESVKISCQNSRHGCKERLIFAKKHDHESECEYTSCSCPLSGCKFIAPPKQLYSHFSSIHESSARSFQYNSSFTISLVRRTKIFIFQEKNDGVLFVLNNTLHSLGNLVKVSCIVPSTSNEGFSYELKANTEDTCLSFQSVMKNMHDNYEKPSLKKFLLIPIDSFGSSYHIKLDIRIWSSDSSESFRTLPKVEDG